MLFELAKSNRSFQGTKLCNKVAMENWNIDSFLTISIVVISKSPGIQPEVFKFGGR